jgi:hypothetical protein
MAWHELTALLYCGSCGGALVTYLRYLNDAGLAHSSSTGKRAEIGRPVIGVGGPVVLTLARVGSFLIGAASPRPRQGSRNWLQTKVHISAKRGADGKLTWSFSLNKDAASDATVKSVVQRLGKLSPISVKDEGRPMVRVPQVRLLGRPQELLLRPLQGLPLFRLFDRVGPMPVEGPQQVPG